MVKVTVIYGAETSKFNKFRIKIYVDGNRFFRSIATYARLENINNVIKK